MYPTFGQVISDARGYLGSVAPSSRYPNEYLLLFARRSLDELYSVFVNNQLRDVTLIKTYTLPANTAEIDPTSIVNLANLSEITFLEEQPDLSSEWSKVSQVDQLPQPYPGQNTNVLGVYTNQQGRFQFNPIAKAEPLRFTFLASGNSDAADESTIIAIDDCRNFLANACAAKAGIGKGDTTEAAAAAGRAYGSGNADPLENLGGYLKLLVDKSLRSMQQAPLRLPRYRAGGGFAYPTAIDRAG